MPKIVELLKIACQLGASDLHIRSGAPPLVRVNGVLKEVNNQPLNREECEEMLLEILTNERKVVFQEQNDVDFAYEVEGLARFRSNFLRQKNGIGAVFRVIPGKFKPLEELGLPPVVKELAKLEKGLVLVTGPTGSGKSTTLAAIIDYINRERNKHIITIEDPLEFIHENKKCLITQREVGAHTRSFASSLRAALREDPDILLIGELRDLETIQLAITAAETGHLVFATLHTNTSSSAVDRIIDVFPPQQQDQIRVMLSETLKGVLAQQLLRRTDGTGRVAAFEILVGSPALSNLIRERKTYQIISVIQTGRREGMITMDQSILELLKQKLITPEEAYEKAIDKETYQQYLKRML